MSPGRSFAEVPYIYCKSPEKFIHFRRDRLHIALDVTDDWHDLTSTADRVPVGFHAVPDTDYEYALYYCQGGERVLAAVRAGVPRMHDFPRAPRGKLTTGPVSGAKHVVKLDGQTYVYVLAIPRRTEEPQADGRHQLRSDSPGGQQRRRRRRLRHAQSGDQSQRPVAAPLLGAGQQLRSPLDACGEVGAVATHQ